jgi:hypothetical protein
MMSTILLVSQPFIYSDAAWRGRSSAAGYGAGLDTVGWGDLELSMAGWSHTMLDSAAAIVGHV